MIGEIYKNNFNPEAIALRYKGQSITYKELDTKVNKYASYFTSTGLLKGDKVVLNSINCPEFLYVYLGIVNLGSIIIPINTMSTFEEISYIVNNSEAKVMIIHPLIFKKIGLEKEYIEKKLLIKLIILNEEFEEKINSISTIDYQKITETNMISTFLYTSGTTGKPKAAMLTHHNLEYNVFQLSFECISVNNYLCVIPMFHAFAFTSIVLVALYTGNTLVIMDSFHPKELIETLIKEEITVFTGVPALFMVLLEAMKTGVKFPKLRYCISGGASIPVTVLKELTERLKFPINEGYGLSEASPTVLKNPLRGIQKAGSVGLPLYGIEAKIVDNNDKEVLTGEVGELIVKGENVMAGYYKNEEETKEALKNGWLYTGDLAKKDEDGYIYIVDRKKDLIIVSGYNVYPREVEDILYKHPKIKEAAVVGIKDDLRGEYVKAFVVLKGGESCTPKELQSFCKQYLSKFKIPRKIEFLQELPKNNTGKILKRVLQENNI